MKNQTLRAGDLTLDYAEGKVRYVKFGSTELVRGMYFAVRDADWGTLPLRCQPERLEWQDRGFTLTFKADSLESDEALVAWECSIQGDASNRITFAITGTFLCAYASNRAGFCLLHPLKQLVGQSFEVITPPGQRQSGTFPRLIAPHQPATDIAGLDWTTANGIGCRLVFEGDVFEMEDQRNWTDASFKTYCTPLKNGWPKTYRKGDTIRQKIVFQMLSYEQKSTAESQPTNSVSYDTSIRFPWPGIGSRIPNGPLENLNPEKIAALPLSLLRADVAWGGSAWETHLKAAIDYAEKCRKPLHLVLHYVQGELTALVDALHRHCQHTDLAALSVVQKDRIAVAPELIQRAHQLIRTSFPLVKTGAGTQYLFTQFNRHRPPPGQRADFVFFGNNPQVHAFDNQSIIETIEGQAETLNSAKSIAPGLPIHVSPIALHAPFSPDKLPKNDRVRDALDYDFAPDPRQGSLFAAGWVLGVLSTLAAEGAGHLDLFETEGARGLIIDQKITPTFALLDRILKQKPEYVFFSQSSNPLNFSSLGIHTKNGPYLYVANHTAERLLLAVDDSWQKWSRLTSENSFSNHEANRTLDLLPHDIFEIVLRT